MKYVIFGLLLFFVFFLIPSCSSPSIKSQVIGSNISWHTRKYGKEEQLKVFGTGSACFNKIEEMTIYYDCYRKVTLEEARRLMVKLVEGMIEHVNSEAIHPELYEKFPITSKAVGLCVAFYKERMTSYEPPTLAIAISGEGKIRYGCENPVTKRYYDVYEESYEEALRIVREEGLEQ